MTQHIIDSDFRVTDSRDSGWQEWLAGKRYLFDDVTEEVVVEEWKSFSNSRRPSENHEDVTSSIVLEPAAVPNEIKEKIIEKFPGANIFGKRSRTLSLKSAHAKE